MQKLGIYKLPCDPTDMIYISDAWKSKLEEKVGEKVDFYVGCEVLQGRDGSYYLLTKDEV